MHQSWDNFAQTHSNAHFLQLSQWGMLKEQYGWTSAIIALDDSGQRIETLSKSDRAIACGAQILYRPLISRSPFNRLPGLKLAYIPKGPLVNWQNHGMVSALLGQIKAECRQSGAGLLKVEPELPDSAESRSLLRRHGFQPSSQTVQPRSTMLLDISKSEDEILAQMKSKWRYNIRLAARKGVSVRTMTADDMPTFGNLMQTTGERNGFHVHDAAYYRQAFDLFVPKVGTFLLAEYQGKPLAAVAILKLGETAWYPWGASSNHERNRMPNYALHWAAIQWAKSQGATLYDFWGIPDPIGEYGMGLEQATKAGIPASEIPVDLQNLPDGELWGVYRLKQGFGGNVYRSVGAWDMPIRKPIHTFYQWGVKLRKQPQSVDVPLSEQAAPSNQSSSVNQAGKQ